MKGTKQKRELVSLSIFFFFFLRSFQQKQSKAKVQNPPATPVFQKKKKGKVGRERGWKEESKLDFILSITYVA